MQNKTHKHYQLLLATGFVLSGLLVLCLVFIYTKKRLTSLVAEQIEVLAEQMAETSTEQLQVEISHQKSELTKQVYIRLISTPQVIYLGGKRHEFYVNLKDTLPLADCGDEVDKFGQLEFVFDQQVVARKNFCGRHYPLIQTHKLNNQYLVFFFSTGKLNPVLAGKNFSMKTGHEQVVIDSSGKLIDTRLVGYNVQLDTTSDNLVYVHYLEPSLISEITPLLPQFQPLAACIENRTTCSKDQLAPSIVPDFAGSGVLVQETINIDEAGKLTSTYQRSFTPESMCSLNITFAIEHLACIQAIGKYIRATQNCFVGALACENSNLECLSRQRACKRPYWQQFLDEIWEYRWKQSTWEELISYYHEHGIEY